MPSCTSFAVLLPVNSSGPPESPKQMLRWACRPVGQEGTMGWCTEGQAQHMCACMLLGVQTGMRPGATARCHWRTLRLLFWCTLARRPAQGSISGA